MVNYMWFRVWREDGRMMAERFLSGDPADAKRQHKEDCLFGWAGSKHRATVTELVFLSDKGSPTYVRECAMRDFDAPAVH